MSTMVKIVVQRGQLFKGILLSYCKRSTYFLLFVEDDKRLPEPDPFTRILSAKARLISKIECLGWI